MTEAREKNQDRRRTEEAGERRQPRRRRKKSSGLLYIVLGGVVLALLVCIALVLRLTAAGKAEDPQYDSPAVIESQEEEISESGGSRSFVTSTGKVFEYTPDLTAALTDLDPEKFRKENGVFFYEDAACTSRAGLDVSRYQGEVDWAKVRAQGFEFVYLRAGYRGYTKGSLAEDPMFEENIKGALRAGMEVGVYFFSQAVNEKEAEEEAEFVLDLIAPYRVTLPVVYDPETISGADSRTDHLTKDQLTKNCIAFCSRVSAAEMEPMIYANMFWQAYKLDMGRLKQYPFWYADYEDRPQTPYRYSIWQYTDTAKIDGISENVDLDIELIRK